MLLGLKFGIIFMLLMNINPFQYLNMPTPTVWQWLASNRAYGTLMTLLIGNALESQLQTSGAFEISYNGMFYGFIRTWLIGLYLDVLLPCCFTGVLIWSKLVEGRILSPNELFQMLSNREFNNQETINIDGTVP